MNVAQVLVSGVITASELGIIAIGLTMTFSILRFANFAHASMAVVGAYLAYFLNVTLGAPLVLAFAVAVLATGLFGIAVDTAIFRVIRGTGDLTPMITSLGLSLVVQYSVQAIWGPQFLRYRYEVHRGLILFGARITPPQIGIILATTVALFAFHALLKFTALGKAMRATATNPELAQACSIDINTVIRAVWFIGTGFAALGGMFVAWDTQLDPYVGSFYGAIAGALIIGVAENVAVNLDLAPLLRPLGLADSGSGISLSSSYKPAVAYSLVVLLLLLRPSGIAQRELI
jgi:branched-subunit amino acid ABC-type transport system permease component